MKEPVFKSNLTMKEIESNFEGMDFFGELMEGLTEALAYSKGQAAGKTRCLISMFPRFGNLWI